MARLNEDQMRQPPRQPPVKLSRCRWEMLTRDFYGMSLHQTVREIKVTGPIEIDGVVFLPAEYVPDAPQA